ncbi:hypothetical protein H4R19_002294, partial [Coemansia spiralis]
CPDPRAGRQHYTSAHQTPGLCVRQRHWLRHAFLERVWRLPAKGDSHQPVALRPLPLQLWQRPAAVGRREPNTHARHHCCAPHGPQIRRLQHRHQRRGEHHGEYPRERVLERPHAACLL